MVRVPSACARLAAGAIFTTIAVPIQAQNWDFENGSLSGWTNSGTAFAAQPTFGNNLPPRRPGETPGQQGNYWVGTYEYHPSPTYELGRTQGDGPVGELLSDPFQINTRTIDFLVGGGEDIVNERVSLLIKVRPGDPPPGNPSAFRHLADGDYVTVLSSTGRNQEEMYRRVWDVTRWQGRAARILIVDNASGPWGHINADDFHVHPGLGTATVVQPQGLGTAVPVGSGGPTPVYVPPAGSGGAGGDGVIVSPPSDQPPAGVRSAHYQLIAYRLHAAQTTVDDPLENDGPGDEIRVRSDVFRYTPAGVMTGWIPHLSGIMGSPDHADIIAGSAHPGWNPHDEQGGFRNGDDYPAAALQNSLSTDGGLPMLLWEGDLTEAGEAVVVVPSIWEIDSRSRSAAENDWDRDLPNQMRARSGYFSSIFTRPIEDNDVPEEFLRFEGFLPRRGGNEPLGYWGGDSRVRPGMYVNWIVLTYNRASLWAAKAGRFVNPVHQWVGTGEMMFYLGNVTDPGGYELFVKLVRTR